MQEDCPLQELPDHVSALDRLMKSLNLWCKEILLYGEIFVKQLFFVYASRDTILDDGI
jgi:hypothetical protein